MKAVSIALSLFLFFSSINTLFAQSGDLLTELPETKEQFISSEKKVLASIQWLEDTPLDQEVDKHKMQYALLTAWITNSPTVTLEINATVLTFTKKNSELIMFFMAGWTRYALLNNYSADIEKGSTAGVKKAVNIYKKGVGLKKDKEMEKLVALDEKGELENWVKEQLLKK